MTRVSGVRGAHRNRIDAVLQVRRFLLDLFREERRRNHHRHAALLEEVLYVFAAVAGDARLRQTLIDQRFIQRRRLRRLPPS